MKVEVNLSPAQSQKFTQQLAVDNAYRTKVYTYFVIFFETLMLIWHFYQDGFSISLYMWFYSSFLLVGIAMLTTVKLYEAKKVSLNKMNRWMFVYYAFTLIWGALVTIADQSSYGHVTAYLTNALTASILYQCSRQGFISLHGAPLIFLVSGLVLYQDDSAVLWGHAINMTIFLIFAFVGARMIYNSFKQSFYQAVLIEEVNERLQLQIEENTRSNERLAELNMHLQEVAVRDELTQIMNRRGLYAYLEKELKYARRHVTVMILDVDHFKAYNDFYGHLEGDYVLRLVAAQLQQIAEQDGHFVARYGGEEFVYIAFEMSKEAALLQGEKIRAAITALAIPHIKSSTSYITISIGIAQHETCDERLVDSIMKKSDEVLYKAKEAGRNRVMLNV